ncbi:S8 family serine peptidase [Wenzhouxiangella sp. XN79A]|uniref:S8 family serine peptidase n=1 Tax=Wenzhouxiangella sp. XN79A TaxID=2724193 RepID=UPI00144A8B1D|nr:S8 family serine peptidase [Wenzhouxiangella sp. XN79A]NKI36585.1 S8 family serine peptidase [Wenzhouxiangella sp. XN79A]
MLKIVVLSGLLLAAGPLAASEDTWLRIDRPTEAQRSAMPPEAIDYGGFLWVPASAARGAAMLDAGPVRTVDSPFAMHVDHQRLDPREAFAADAEGLMRGTASAEADFRLVQFEGPIKAEWRAALAAAGARPVQYLAPFAYIVWADPGAIEAARALKHVRFAGEFPPVLRIPMQARRTPDPHSHAMALIHAGSAARVVERLRQAGAEVVGEAAKVDAELASLQLRALPSAFERLARIPGVLTVQQIGQDAGPRGEMSNQSVVGGWTLDPMDNRVLEPGYLDWLTPTGLDGSGITVGIVDNGIQDTHPDLVDNIGNCAGSGPSCGNASGSHGTHVAGAVGGSGASGVVDPAGFLRGQGVAPGVTLVEQLYGPLVGAGPGGMVPNGMLSIYRDAADSGAQLTNNSWGPTGSPQGYDIPTMEIDFISRDADPDTPGQQPVLAVWSIMNGGGDGFGSCSPSSLGSPDEAKNLFAVGSTRLQTGVGAFTSDFFSVSSNSAHGPACDGRLVPHIVAPGCSTDSPDSASGYGLACGTSMASPVVSGGVALFWQQYRAEFGTDPSPAMVKAAFTPIASDLVGNNDADGNELGHRPDRKQGWGRLDLDAVVNPPLERRFFDQQTVLNQSGDSWSVQLEPADPTEPVRLMLVWTDAPGPGTGGTTAAWVNDLDLEVVTGSDIYIGNQFGSDGFSTSGGEGDSINNMEGVFLRADQVLGEPFTVNVLAVNIAEDALDVYADPPGPPRQDFALACYNCRELPPSEDLFADGFELPPAP